MGGWNAPGTAIPWRHRISEEGARPDDGIPLSPMRLCRAVREV